MKPEVCLHRFSELCCFGSQPEQTADRPQSAFLTHSSQHALNNLFSSHSKVAKSKQHEPMRLVLGQSFIANLSETELTLYHPKVMLDLGTDAVFDLFQFVLEGVAGFGFAKRFALAWHHGNLPVLAIACLS